MIFIALAVLADTDVYTGIAFAKREKVGEKEVFWVRGRLHVIIDVARGEISERSEAPGHGKRLGEFRDV